MSDFENLAEWHETRGELFARLSKGAPENTTAFVAQAADHFTVSAHLRTIIARAAEHRIALAAPFEPAIQPPPAAPTPGKRKPRT